MSAHHFVLLWLIGTLTQAGWFEAHCRPYPKNRAEPCTPGATGQTRDEADGFTV